MAKIAIIVEYQPKLEHYPDCTTIAECVQMDIDALNNGEMYAGEFIDNYECEAKGLDFTNE